MAATAEKKLGRFKVEVELANNDDMASVRRGHLAADKVRRTKRCTWNQSETQR